jgi:hypothetical protein
VRGSISLAAQCHCVPVNSDVSVHVTVVLEREGKKPLERPSEVQIRQALVRTKMSFASITADDGGFLQVAGGPGLFVLERRTADGTHFRARQDTPVVRFEDGTTLSFSGGELTLQRDEWFLIEQVVEAFCAFAQAKPLPEFLRWSRLDDHYAYAR